MSRTLAVPQISGEQSFGTENPETLGQTCVIILTSSSLESNDSKREARFLLEEARCRNAGSPMQECTSPNKGSLARKFDRFVK